MSDTVNIATAVLLKKRRDGQVLGTEQGTQGTGNTVTGAAAMWLLRYFELMEAGTTDEYLRLKLPFSCDYEVTAWSDEGQFPPSIFESMPYATASVVGGIKVGTGLSITNGVLSATGSVGFNEAGNYAPTGTWAFTQAPTVGGVVVSLNGHTHDDRYFTESETTSAISSAIAALVDSAPGTLDTLHELATALGDDPNFATTVSTALGNRMLTSHPANGITGTNITNWNSAFGWGNHASAGYLTTQISHSDVLVDGDFTSNGLMNRTGAGTYSIVTDYLTSSHTSSYNHSNYNTAYNWVNSYGYTDYVRTGDSRLTDARTPVSHNNTYHSETYITSAALSPYAPLASPTFTGKVIINTITAGQNALTISRASGYSQIKGISNLMMDSANGEAIYMNHYCTGDTFINTGGGKLGIRTEAPLKVLSVHSHDDTAGMSVARTAMIRVNNDHTGTNMFAGISFGFNNADCFWPEINT